MRIGLIQILFSWGSFGFGKWCYPNGGPEKGCIYSWCFACWFVEIRRFNDRIGIWKMQGYGEIKQQS